MSNNMFDGMKLSKKDKNRIEKKARRDAQDRDIYTDGTRVHKNKKKYKREKYRHQE